MVSRIVWLCILLLSGISVDAQGLVVQKNKELRLHIPKGNTWNSGDLVFTNDNKYLVSSNWLRHISVWDLDREKEQKTLSGTHDYAVNKIIVSRDGKNIISCGNDSYVCVTEISTGNLIKAISDSSWVIRFATDSLNRFILFGGSRHKHLKLYDALKDTISCTFGFGERPPSTLHYYELSGDGKRIIWWDDKLRLLQEYDIAGRKNVRSLHFPAEPYKHLGLTKDLRKALLYLGSKINIIDLESFTVINTLVIPELETQELFTETQKMGNDRIIILDQNERKVKIYLLHSGAVEATFAFENQPLTACFSKDEQFLAISLDNNVIKIYDVKDGYKLQKELGSDLNSIGSSDYDVKSKCLYVSDFSAGRIKKIDFRSAGITKLFSCKKSNRNSNHDLIYNDNTLVVATRDSVTLFSTEGNKQLSSFPMGKDDDIYLTSLKDSFVLYTVKDDSMMIRHIRTGKFIKKQKMKSAPSVFKLYGNRVYMSYNNGWTVSYDIVQFNPVDSFNTGFRWCTDITATENPGEIIFSGIPRTRKFKLAKEQTILCEYQVWDINKRTITGSFSDHRLENERSLVIGNLLFTASRDMYVSVWDYARGLRLNKFGPFSDLFTGIYPFYPGNDKNNFYLLITSADGTITLFDWKNEKTIAKLFTFGDDDWVVTHDNLFDASANAFKKLYFSYGNEIIELDQLKKKFYEPNLLEKLMGLNNDPIREADNRLFTIYPKIEKLQMEKSRLSIFLNTTEASPTKVSVFINNREVWENCVSAGKVVDNGMYRIDLDLTDNPYLVRGNNAIKAISFSADELLRSPERTLQFFVESIPTSIPRTYILGIGVSRYSNPEINLKWPAKDCKEIANALTLGATKLFGMENTRCSILHSEAAEDSIKPKKENIIRKFDQIIAQANAEDVVILYLAGHGFNFLDTDFYFLTEDAASSSPEDYADKSIRDKVTISSTELIEKLKKIRALKQFMIIDACGSGKTLESFAINRSVSSSTLRALERLKDRTGVHIITGCAANAVSYESSYYAQGLLTYSLLEGIKGASLREDKFIDVQSLIKYSLERVPVLASTFNQKQKPQSFSPVGSESFDIGEITQEEKDKIQLAKPKPIVVKSMFMDKSSFNDPYGISLKLDEKLREIALQGKKAAFVFFETNEYPDAYRISGLYSVKKNTIYLEANIFYGQKPIGNVRCSAAENAIESIIGCLLDKVGAIK